MAEKQIQIKLSPSDQQDRLVDRLVEVGYLKDRAAVASACLSRALPELVAECLNHEAFLNGQRPELTVETRAASFVRALAERRKISLLELQQLADELGVPSESLAEMVAVRCCCETEEQSSAKSRV